MDASAGPQRLDCIIGRDLGPYRRLRLLITATAALQVVHASDSPQIIELPPGASWEDLIGILLRLLDAAA